MKGIRLTHASGIDPWVGDRGTCFLVEDDVAAEAVASGLLEYIPDDEHNVIPVVQAEGVQFPDPDERPREMTLEERYAEILNADGSPKDSVFAEGGIIGRDEREPQELPGVARAGTDVAPEGKLKKPYGNASKSAWIAYAIQQGEKPDTAESMSKIDLMSKYGERL
jgi:hypothetical protein